MLPNFLLFMYNFHRSLANTLPSSILCLFSKKGEILERQAKNGGFAECYVFTDLSSAFIGREGDGSGPFVGIRKISATYLATALKRR